MIHHGGPMTSPSCGARLVYGFQRKNVSYDPADVTCPDCRRIRALDEARTVNPAQVRDVETSAKTEVHSAKAGEGKV